MARRPFDTVIEPVTPFTPEERLELWNNICKGDIDEPREDLPLDPKIRIAELVTRRNALVMGIQRLQKEGDQVNVGRLRNAVTHTNALIAKANAQVVDSRPVIRKSN